MSSNEEGWQYSNKQKRKIRAEQNKKASEERRKIANLNRIIEEEEKEKEIEIEKDEMKEIPIIETSTPKKQKVWWWWWW